MDSIPKMGVIVSGFWNEGGTARGVHKTVGGDWSLFWDIKLCEAFYVMNFRMS